MNLKLWFGFIKVYGEELQNIDHFPSVGFIWLGSKLGQLLKDAIYQVRS